MSDVQKQFRQATSLPHVGPLPSLWKFPYIKDIIGAITNLVPSLANDRFQRLKNTLMS